MSLSPFICGTLSEFPISKIMVGQSLPRVGDSSTWAAFGKFGLGRGLGMKDLSGCFLRPGKSVSSNVSALMEEFLTLSTPALERCRSKGRRPRSKELGCEVEMKEIADLIMRRAGEL